MPGGLHVLVLTLPPNFKRDASAMHATPSVDCIMQVSGESVFVMEDTDVHLRAGDWLISNGVTHSWRNDRDETSVMIGVVYGAQPNGTPPQRSKVVSCGCSNEASATGL
jgi:mannose-6-phosphate isomerase-like protein (cupin superfamily)